MRETQKERGPSDNETEDHPRVCGKHAAAKAAGLEEPGSPPRMRETPISDFV